MDTSTAAGAHSVACDPKALPTDLQQALTAAANLLATTDPTTISLQETRAALAASHEIAQHLAAWESTITAHRDECVLRLWTSGQTQTEIAGFLGVPKTTVHAILAAYRARATPQEQAAYARRAAEEFEVEALAEIGNLFAAQEPA